MKTLSNMEREREELSILSNVTKRTTLINSSKQFIKETRVRDYIKTLFLFIFFFSYKVVN